jgi:two-component system NtrC family response regulator
MAHILIIDDDPLICETISHIVNHLGHEATTAHSLQEGIKKTSSGAVDVVLLDVQLPDGNGLDALPRIWKGPSSPEIIILTGYGDPDGAELAIKNGAWDYLEKPSSTQKISLTLTRALQYRQQKEAATPAESINREGIVGNSHQMRDCLDLVAQAAKSNVNVLITGETGTGKELFALAIHNNSRRTPKSFVVVDCAALPKNLVESVLFGHEKGAFTSADKAQEGLIRQADGGTLFLDEVGELPPSVQKSFLRVLQERRFRTVGGKEEIESDFRLIAASNRDLDDLVRRQQFREDLLFRLRTFTIELPPLRERPEDIEELGQHYIAQFAEEHGTQPKDFSPEFMGVLAQYPWPGNVRELIHALERAFAAALSEPILYPKHLPTHIRTHVARTSIRKKAAPAVPPYRQAGPAPAFLPLQKVREDAIANVERRYLKDLIEHTEGDIQQACHISGLSRSRLYSLLKKYRISSVRLSPRPGVSDSPPAE